MPIIGPDIIVVFMTGCLWFWVMLRASAAKKARKGSKKEGRLASLSFGILIGLEITAILAPQDYIKYAISLISYTTFILFAFYSCPESDGFWTKRRNKIIGSMIVFAYASGAPFVFAEPIYIPLTFALFLAHISNRNLNLLLTGTIKDLQSVQVKLLSLDAKIKTSEIMHKFKPAPGLRSVGRRGANL